VLSDAERVLFLHAHPDDEVLATGVLIADLVARGVAVAVVTATRGERGEVVPGPLSPLAGTPALVARRETELAGAMGVLGVNAHSFLGDPPALAAGAGRRRYTDSGMVWVEPGLAGPAPGTSPDALAHAPVEQAAADLAAFIDWWGADRVVSYDSHGGYGHPDHVACHAIAVAAAAVAGVRCVEVVSEARLARARPDAQFVDLSRHLGVVADALRRHASQVTVDGADVVHAGGQRERILTSLILQPAPRP
jgi:N-acetyl-1-D-myo-inositol-2-amino-2-deoxy-alpha-D-glucopyranoside deacetylase